MGRKNQRKQNFLREHPYCCFCGGVALAEEPDHIPGRAFFIDRHWPEGFEFPACVRCNRITKDDEQVAAMLSFFAAADHDPSCAAQGAKLIRGVGRFQRDIILEMNPSARTRRNAAVRYGLKAGDGSYANLPVVSIGTLVDSAVSNFSKKLFCALYYRHCGRALPRTGGILTKWWSNVQVMDGQIPEQIAQHLLGVPELKRSNRLLDNQFTYRWTIAESEDAAVFLAFFREAFAILGFVQGDASKFDPAMKDDIIYPFDHIA